MTIFLTMLHEKNETTSVKKDCNDFWWLINNRNSNRRNDSLYILRGRFFTTFTRRGRSEVVLAMSKIRKFSLITIKEFLHECQLSRDKYVGGQ